MPGAILGAVCRNVQVQVFMELALLKEQKDKLVISEGEKTQVLGA